MSPFTLLSLSAETARARADALAEVASGSGSCSERRWGLWAFGGTVAVLVLVVLVLHAG